MARLVLMLVILGIGSLMAYSTSAIQMHAADIAALLLGSALIVAGVCAAIFMRVRSR